MGHPDPQEHELQKRGNITINETIAAGARAAGAIRPTALPQSHFPHRRDDSVFAESLIMHSWRSIHE